MNPETEVKTRQNWAILQEKHGQLRSMEEMLPVGPGGEPIPWYTYPALEQLAQFDFSGCSVFEYGCGHSSLWWASRAARVTSVDHDSKWLELVAARAPQNLLLRAEAEQGSYVGSIREAGGPYDVIVIDGRWRLACAGEAPEQLKPGGLIVFDNSDWYVEAPGALIRQGFCRFDYSGFGPINNYCWTTSLLCRADLRLPRVAQFVAPVGGLTSCGDHCD